MNVRSFRRKAGVLCVFASLALLAFAASACSDDDDAAATTPTVAAPSSTAAATASTLTITDVSARATTNDVSAVYFTVKNTGVADKLVKASTTVTTNVQLHETVTEGGTSRMQQVPGFDVPPNGELVLKPGGFHVMLLDLKAPLVEGQSLEVKLTFEKAGVVTIAAPIRQPGSSSGMGMNGGMGSGMATPTKMP